VVPTAADPWVGARAPYTRAVVTAPAESGFQSIGQPAARALAQRAAASDRLQRTLLVHGPAGAGKDTFVDDLLALLFCEADGARPCNACRGCRDARARRHPDLVVGSPDAWRTDRSTGESIVAAARRWLLTAAGAPIVAPRRIVLIEGADRANEQTQNALLKALEEPGARQMFILVADEPGRLLPTIRSRAQPMRIGPVPRAELAGWLMDRERLPADQADVLARVSSGMVGTARAYARTPELVAWRRRVQGELLALLGHGVADRFAAVGELIDGAVRMGGTTAVPADAVPTDDDVAGVRVASSVQRDGALRIVDAWLELTRDLVVAAAGQPDLAPAVDLLPELADVARRIPAATLATFARTLDRVHDGLGQNAAPRLALEAAMLDWPSLKPAAT
jgi:DNA polymerase-3 subunit delta'